MIASRFNCALIEFRDISVMIGIAIVARSTFMICHDFSWIEYEECALIQSFLNCDWVSWNLGHANCALTKLANSVASDDCDSF